MGAPVHPPQDESLFEAPLAADGEPEPEPEPAPSEPAPAEDDPQSPAKAKRKRVSANRCRVAGCATPDLRAAKKFLQRCRVCAACSRAESARRASEAALLVSRAAPALG
jgi:hypothetical protein